MLKHFSILKSETWHARRCLLLRINFSVARCRGFTPYLVVSFDFSFNAVLWLVISVVCFDFSFNAVLWLVMTALARKKVSRDLTFSGVESRQISILSTEETRQIGNAVEGSKNYWRGRKKAKKAGVAKMLIFIFSFFLVLKTKKKKNQNVSIMLFEKKVTEFCLDLLINYFK